MTGTAKRHHEVAIRIGADTWDDLLQALEQLRFDLSVDGPGRKIISGGYNYGMIFIDETNESATHDSYFEEVEKWLEEHK